MTGPFDSHSSTDHSSQASAEIVRAFISILLSSPQPTTQQTDTNALPEAYRRTLAVIWAALIPWISSVGAHAVLLRALDLSGRSWSFLRLIQLTEAGVDPQSVHHSLEGIDRLVATSALTETVLCLLEVLESIAGDVLVRVVLERVQSVTDDHSTV